MSIPAKGPRESSARIAAFRAVVERLRKDKFLSNHVVKWKAIPFRAVEPTVSDLPFVIISLAAGPIGVASPNSLANSLVISIRYAVDASGAKEDTAWEDVIVLYEGIERALFGEPGWLRDAIHAADPTAIVNGDVQFTKAGFTTIPVADINAIQAECTVSIPLKIKPCRST